MSSPVIIDSTTLHYFENFFDDSIESPIVCVKCDKISTKNKKDSKRIMISTTGIHILQLDKKTKYSAPREADWFSLLTMTETSHKSIIFKFSDEKIEIFHKEYKKIGKLTKAHLLSFMKEQELPVISLDDSNDQAQTEATQLNPYTRFTNLMFSKVKGITGADLKKYVSFFENGKEEISLSNFQKVIADNLDDFFNCVQYFKNITKIIIDIPISEKEIAPILRFLKYTKRINTVVFNGNFSFTKVPELLYVSNSLRKLECVNCSNMNSLNLKFLINLINDNSFESISFANSLNGELFTELFNNIQGSDSIKSFYVSDVSNIDFEHFKIIGKNLENITFLNAAFEISEMINQIEVFKNLKVLNFSSNCVKKQINNVEFPKTLEKLILNQVVWKNSSLSDLFNILQKINDHYITLSFNDISFYGYYWDDFFEDLALCAPIDIIELSWNNNRLSSKFFKYIKNCKHLRRLSIFNCLKINNSVTYYLGEYLVKSKTLKKINISVDDCEIQEAEVSSLFTSISHNKSLNSISMCGFRCNKMMFELLINCLLENRRITELDFDFKNIDSEEFEEFLDRLIVRGPPLLIKKEYVIRFLTSQKTIEKYHTLIRGDKSIKPPYETISTDTGDLLISGQLMKVKKSRNKSRTKSSTISIPKSDMLSFRERFNDVKNKVNKLSSIPTSSINLVPRNEKLSNDLPKLIPPIEAENQNMIIIPPFIPENTSKLQEPERQESLLMIPPPDNNLLPDSLISNIPENKDNQTPNSITNNENDEENQKKQLNSLAIPDSVNKEQIPTPINQMYIPTIHEVTRNRSQTICESPNANNSLFQQFREIGINQRQMFRKGNYSRPSLGKFNLADRIIPPIQAEPKIVKKKRVLIKPDQLLPSKKLADQTVDMNTALFYQEEIDSLCSFIASSNNQSNKSTKNQNDIKLLNLDIDEIHFCKSEDDVKNAKKEFNVENLLEMIRSN